MKFPVTVRHRNTKAKIYAPGGKFAYYRLAYAVSGKRRMQTFAAYSAAREAAERIVKELSEGSQAAALTATQSRDALAAIERLQSYYQSSGRRVSLLGAVSEYVEASAKLNGHTLAEAVAGFQRTEATIQRKDIKEAVSDFIATDTPRTKASEGQRAQLSAKYAYNRQIQLNKFAATFPGNAVSDLTKAHLDTFIGGLSEFSAKSRNHYRAAVRQFLQWAMRGTSRREDAAFWIIHLTEAQDAGEVQTGARFVARFVKNRNATEADCPPLEWHFHLPEGETHARVNWKKLATDTSSARVAESIHKTSHRFVHAFSRWPINFATVEGW